MSWTQEDLANLKKAFALGAKKTRIAGEEVEYRSLSEMKEIIDMIERDLAGQPRSDFIQTIYES
ncbi:phage head-tail joining protein [Cohaesibacter intestini]|jgi:hypothetical protein|uniref:phage head-tail joining protein n=1 Tax=Cohaesibacter intestini TaxID=2211145 RepID=UPI000DE894ED|nr:hypothetical protein [Cohaesibacter intestini]